MHFSVVTRFALATLLLTAATARAQGPWHYLNKADMPPGVIGLRQLERGGPLPGYFQPVEVTSPEGTLISLAAEGGFADAQKEKTLAGLLIGQVYRLRVSNIKFREGEEVFPTIEVIDRLYPPPGQAARFPIPIELTDEELKLALDGQYVLQRYFEIGTGEDAMMTADRLGRPVAILRMGSRVPLAGETDPQFLYQNPPVQRYEKPVVLPRQEGLEPPLDGPPQLGRPSRNFPRERLLR
jgi:hypothetical protein